jgi:L-fucose isomerase-like protein
MNRTVENGKSPPDLTRGTLEGDIAAGDITFYRLHGNPDGSLQAYIAQGEILPPATHSFGGIGIFAIPEMGRFYRHVLIAKHYPHHGAVAFGKFGKALFTVFDYLGVPDIAYNRPKGVLYPTENPFAYEGSGCIEAADAASRSLGRVIGQCAAMTPAPNAAE